jgi:hypothetical protein
MTGVSDREEGVMTMALTDGDREWLQGNFDRLHDRINETNENAAQAKLDTVEKIAVALKEHRDEFHNPGKTLGILTGLVTIVIAVVELLKWLVKKG